MDSPHLHPVTGGSDGVPPVTEADLHAYVDGLLTTDRRAAIEAFLELHPDERRKVADWQAQNDALKTMLDPVLAEPLPQRLLLLQPANTWPWRSMAAGVVIAVLSAGSSWWVRGTVDDNAQRMANAASRIELAAGDAKTLRGFAHRAAVAHAVYSPDMRRPVEVGAEQEQALVTWLTKRMGTSVRPPDLRSVGYALIGGRLLPGDKGPVAQFMFDGTKGERLTLYVTREDAGRETAFRFGQDGPVNVFYWVDKDFGYAISAGADRQALLKVAEAVYKQLEPR
jgi:anti-sigma factor RsiW